MPGLSSKDLEVVSYLELNNKFFFEKDEIRRFFKSKNEMAVYIHRLKKKGRIVKLNRTKYYLIPVRAYKGHWSEHPFIVVDEIFNGKGYFIGGMAAAHHWGLIDQIPSAIEVYSTGRQGQRIIFDFTLIFKRVRRSSKQYVKRKIGEHTFLIASEGWVKKWLGSR